MIPDSVNKPCLICKILVMAAAMAYSGVSASAADRYAVASGDWTNPSIWSATPGGAPGAGVPGKVDDVFIENGHTVTLTADAECLSITFTGAFAILTVNSPATLTLKNSITLNKLTDLDSECRLTGSGTLTCVGVEVGSEINPLPVDPSYSIHTHTFTSSIANLLLAVKGSPRNNLTINSYIGSSTHISNGVFNLESGVITIDGKLITNNLDAVNTSTFSMATGSQSGTLILNGRLSPFTLSGTGINSLNLNGLYSLVNYSYAGIQTALGTTYNNITLSGTGIKTVTGITVNGILSLEGLATASGTEPVYNSQSGLQYKGSAAQVTGIEFPPTFSGTKGVIIDNVNGVTLNGNRIISSKLTFINGRLSTGANTLGLTSAAEVLGAGAGKYVNGNLQKGIAAATTAKTFEIGDINVYTPVNLTFTGIISTEGNITVNTTPGDHPNIGSSTFNSGVTVNRYWSIANSGVSGFISYNVTFTFVPGDIDLGADFNYFYVGNYRPSTWIYPAVGTLASTSTQATGINYFGDFQVGELPISSFRSRQSGDWNVVSTWEAFDGTNWIPAITTPNSSSGYVIIRSPHVVTNTSAITVDQLIIDPGSRLVINTGMNVADGPSVDFSVNGTLDCFSGNLTGTGSFLLNSFADIIIRSPDGISSAGASGDILTSSRTYSSWASFTYAGTVAQVTGDGLPASLNNLTIDNSSGVSHSGSITVNGTITLNSGTFSVGSDTLTLQTSDIPLARTSGTITMSSASTLSFGSPGSPLGATVIIPPGTFTTPPEINTLLVYRASGLTLNEQPLSVNGMVRTNGPLATNGNLILLSTPSGTALVDGTGTGEITGNVTMQRYLPSGFGYKYVSSPFKAAAVDEFADDIDLAAVFPTFYRYNEASTTSGWVTYTSPSGMLNPLIGYAANFGSSPAASTLDVRGEVNNGIQSVTLYNNNNTYTQGFNLAGNPYPSPVDWDAPSGWTKTNIDNALYYFKASTTDEYGGTYSTYINGISSDGLATSVIPSMQGFFIHVSDGSFPVTATLGSVNSVRITDQLHPFVKSDIKGTKAFLRLCAAYADGRDKGDPLVIYFNDKATNDFDRDLDALKLMNTDFEVPSFYSVGSDETRLSINSLTEYPGSPSRIPLGIKTEKDGFIIFSATHIGEGLSSGQISITDIVSGDEYDLRNNGSYKVYLESGEHKERFYLNLSSLPVEIPDPPPASEVFSVYSSHGLIMISTEESGEAKTNILTISNLSGQILFIKKDIKPGFQEFNPGIKDGIYIITYTSGNIRHSKKILMLNK